MKRLMVALVLLALSSASMSARAEVVAQVMLAAGNVSAVRASKALPLAPGMMIEDKDTLHTGKTGSLQLRFTDNSIMFLRENSELTIEKYHFSGRVDGFEKAFYRLVKGGLSTITGLVGRDNYRIESITATIGIRGTEFTLMACQSGSCRNADGSTARNGLYGEVIRGIVAATTKRGEFRFGASEIFYAASLDRPVEKLIAPPVFLRQRVEAQKSGNTQTNSGDGSSAEAAESSSSGTSTSDSSGREQNSNTRLGMIESLKGVDRPENAERPEKVERPEIIERPEKAERRGKIEDPDVSLNT